MRHQHRHLRRHGNEPCQVSLCVTDHISYSREAESDGWTPRLQSRQSGTPGVDRLTSTVKAILTNYPGTIFTRSANWGLAWLSLQAENLPKTELYDFTTFHNHGNNFKISFNSSVRTPFPCWLAVYFSMIKFMDCLVNWSSDYRPRQELCNGPSLATVKEIVLAISRW